MCVTHFLCFHSYSNKTCIHSQTFKRISFQRFHISNRKSGMRKTKIGERIPCVSVILLKEKLNNKTLPH